MYKMGLLNGNRTKSANIVGQTMKQMKGKANPGAVNKMLKELL